MTTRFVVLFALGLAACAPPPPIQEPVRSERAPPGFPAGDYERMSQHGMDVFAVDPPHSRVLIEVGRAGRLARLGHEHAIVAHDVRGYVAPQAGRADFFVGVDTLIVDEPDARREAGLDTQPSPDDIAGTRENMLGKVFDAGRHPFVRLRVASAEVGRPPAQVAVEVNGVERSVPVTLQLRSEAKRLVASGGFSLDQSDFGIVPFSVLGGALQVRDRVDVRFTIATHLLDATSGASTLPRAGAKTGEDVRAMRQEEIPVAGMRHAGPRDERTPAQTAVRPEPRLRVVAIPIG